MIKLFLTKHGCMKFAIHCILFLFTLYTAPQLSWNWGCKLISYSTLYNTKNDAFLNEKHKTF